jgi:hypothetical protein
MEPTTEMTEEVEMGASNRRGVSQVHRRLLDLFCSQEILNEWIHVHRTISVTIFPVTGSFLTLLALSRYVPRNSSVGVKGRR